MPIIQSRRRFLSNLAFTGAAGLVGAGTASLGNGGRSFAAEPPPEITTIRLKKDQAICEAPRYAAEDLLHAEGFTDVRYIELKPGRSSMPMIANGELDFVLQFPPELLIAMDDRRPITILAGVHAGCFELFGTERIRSIADLKGRTVGTQVVGTTTHLVSMMASYVGLDPAKDIRWLIDPSVKPIQLFVERKIDAFLAIPPETQELRARNIGHVIVNSALDRPWSQYFCCILAGNTEFVRKHPVATKRILRAILKATDLCASEPGRVAQLMVDGGFTDRYDYALQMLTELPYGRWRDYDPEDTMRWYALRLHEAGFIKSSPQRLIAEHVDWRFLNELKRELKV
jgi:NitT/TauT family transport system substrate-binding protein